MIDVRFHSRGGQGGVTAAKLLGLAAFLEGKFSSAFPLYGAERRGAPVMAFTRIDDTEIKIYSPVHHPDCIIIMDSSIIELIDITEGLKDGGMILIDNDSDHRFPEFERYTVFAVDATKIALDLNLIIAGIPILNTAILGALAKIGIIKLNSAKRAIKMMFPEEEESILAAEYAYEQVWEV